MSDKDRFYMKAEVGNYYKILDEKIAPHNTLFVGGIINDAEYEVWSFFGDRYYEGEMVNFKNYFSIDQWNSMIANQQIIQIAPPTFFIVTSKNTYQRKEEIKRAGGKWSRTLNKWYFYERPQQFTTKEVVLFPYTGKNIY
ncbi:hypothetical protein [Clostridium beijerinckii]|uniref:hypothetical protein n=1 Tax=Clostridium beijerinckii TaxID=1520 RepID=UPI001F362D6A|nr:hypothetical protein [Clostridium beijerinckii]